MMILYCVSWSVFTLYTVFKVYEAGYEDGIKDKGKQVRP